ncbi:PREDICTED: integral membrane protein GPR155-like isoform X2 [Poecilia mexicana]|uniref:integral membrane protein GPR155-like isoform X2 n=1 Tax=Poecilia mexicana TaxID=48701 RepID=UPI00072DFC64|nr:PREDICTED: integral membrane protein GPR155-like isoform X2 [Poecilia mexicana]
MTMRESRIPVYTRFWSHHQKPSNSQPSVAMETPNNYVFIHGKNISHNTLAGSAVGPHMSIDKLFPALLECFGIILCGYIAGRTDMITESQAKGLGNFVSKFALPALLFKNMVVLDFGDVIWAFLWSVLVAKVTVFVLVCVLTLMVASPDNRYSKAGLYAIFATQSNDFALGYPIVDALYRSTYPEYLQYIYLVAPVSLMLLNPIGFALCEVQSWRQASHLQHNSLGILGIVVLQVLKNPIVFMVIVGIISHFALGERIPSVLSEFIDGLANSFGGAALFYLGLTMAGRPAKKTNQRHWSCPDSPHNSQTPGDAVGLQRHGGHPGCRGEQHKSEPHQFIQFCFSLWSLSNCTKRGYICRPLQHGAGGGEFLSSV